MSTGHTRLAVKLEIYTHEDCQAQHDAPGEVVGDFTGSAGRAGGGQAVHWNGHKWVLWAQ